MAAYTTIDNPELYFQVKLYAGDGNSTQAITLDGSENMQPDLVWLKNRTDDVWHVLTDSVQGAGAANGLSTNSSEAAGGGNKASYGFLSAFGSDGFTVSEGSSNASMSNQSSKNYVAWCWKETATAGFDIVSYTGNGSDRTISHSLSAVPKAVIIKTRGSADAWVNFFPALDITLAFDSTNANNHSSKFNGFFNSTDPTSSVFSIGDDDQTNKNTDTFIAYLFAEKQGFSKFGSYTGNGNADGAFIYTGFRPAWFMQKNTTDAADNWHIFDTKRDTGNQTDEMLFANASSAEATGNAIDLLSNGVKIRNTSNGMNGSGDNYIFMAFAEQPFVNSKGVPCNAR